MFRLSILTSLIFLCGTTARAAEQAPELTNVPVSNVLDQSPVKTDKDKVIVELFSYEDFVYTGSRKTELGDQTRLFSRFRYQITDHAWTSLGFNTNPDQDRFDNKTSDFEFRTGYIYENLVGQADFSLNTNDPDGGMSFGFDLDSENTFLRYRFGDSNFQLTFFPFNFDGAVGVVFDTGDVTRIYYIQGTPAAIPLDPNLSATDPLQIAQKTIPGFVLRYNDVQSTQHINGFYLGIGATSYEFPTEAGFNILQTSTSQDWSRKEAIGYKLGGLIRRPQTFNSFQFISQTQTEETGALLRSAASIYSLSRMTNWLMTEFEVTASEGGKMPWRVDRDGNFGNTDLFITNTATNRVFADRNGNMQDWVGEWGYGASARVGWAGDDYRPYVSYRYMTEHFVYQSRISAHNLRDNLLTFSHGGLHGIGFGAFIYHENFIINPRFEYLKAQNDVFTKASELSQFPISQTRTDNDFSFFINVSYFFDFRTGPRTFRL
jgi:hypothetical protein